MSPADGDSFDACIVGAGPAGATVACRLATLGHRVLLVERAVFPRVHFGESLSRGVPALLDLLGVDARKALGNFALGADARVCWESVEPRLVQAASRGHGAVVQRGAFDAAMLEAARDAGACILQPAQVMEAARDGNEWSLRVATDSTFVNCRAVFLVDATGRRSAAMRDSERSGARTLALWAHASGGEIPRETLIESLSDGWCWAAPLPGGIVSAMAFVDPATARHSRGVAGPLLRQLLARTTLMRALAEGSLGPVRVLDATARRARDPIATGIVRVGDAALALDPLSSSGVEKAMQGGLAASTTIHTLLRRPQAQALCERFYRARQQEAAAEHRRMAAEHYGTVERFAGHAFWSARAAAPDAQPQAENTDDVPRAIEPETRLRMSPTARIDAEPCIVDEEIREFPTLRHPRLARPVAFIEGEPLGRLLEIVGTDYSLAVLERAWSRRMPPPKAARIARWLVANRVLELVHLRPGEE